MISPLPGIDGAPEWLANVSNWSDQQVLYERTTEWVPSRRPRENETIPADPPGPAGQPGYWPPGSATSIPATYAVTNHVPRAPNPLLLADGGEFVGASSTSLPDSGRIILSRGVLLDHRITVAW